MRLVVVQHAQDPEVSRVQREIRPGADGLDVVDAGCAAFGDGDAADGAAVVTGGKCLLAHATPCRRGVEVSGAAVRRLRHRMPGRKMNSPSNSTATNAKNTFDEANGAIGGSGSIVSSHKNITTTNNISIIIVATPVGSWPRLGHGGV